MYKYETLKRLFDIVFAMFALLATGLFILIGAVAVKLSSPGPAFYRAKRAGLRGKPFIMYKLRTMRVGLDTGDRKVTEENDDRITLGGRFLRKFEIDEFPQFWNVLKGDMSVVGPRPEECDIVEKYYSLQERRTLEVRPGVVSPFDVHWYPDITYHDPPPQGTSLQEYYLQRHMPVQLAEAMDYIQHQSLLLDLTVIVQTVYCMLVRSWLAPPQKQTLILKQPHD